MRAQLSLSPNVPRARRAPRHARCCLPCSHKPLPPRACARPHPQPQPLAKIDSLLALARPHTRFSAPGHQIPLHPLVKPIRPRLKGLTAKAPTPPPPLFQRTQSRSARRRRLGRRARCRAKPPRSRTRCCPASVPGRGKSLEARTNTRARRRSLRPLSRPRFPPLYPPTNPHPPPPQKKKKKDKKQQ